ncbi:MAG: sensor histidine kinase [Chloroflexi bacterium]|nr:sensor histidine kinase [Chloroflexota bacterium]
MKLHATVISNTLIKLSGFIVVLVISLLGLMEFFVQDSGTRWLALGLTVGLVLLELFIQVTTWCHNNTWRQRLIVLLMSLITVALLQIPPQIDIFIIIFFVLSVTAAMFFEPKEWAIWIAGFALITAIFYIGKYGLANGLFSTIIYAAAYYFFASFAKATNDAQAAQQESQRLYQELESAHHQLQDYAGQVESLTIMQERSRMAREMHDTVGHRLTVAAVQLEAAQRLIPQNPDKAAAMVETVRHEVTAALAELRQTVAALRAPLEEDLSLPQALQRLVDGFQQATGIESSLTLPPQLPQLSAQQRTALLRAAQECLTNVQKHAQAHQVSLRLEREGQWLALVVDDDGRGISPQDKPTGFGLKGLKERASLLGGKFEISSRPEGGTRASFRIPVP